MEVKASEIVPAGEGGSIGIAESVTAGNFGIGYTMRFPRCKYIYWDKATRDNPGADDSQDRDMWNAVSEESLKRYKLMSVAS